MRGPVRARRGQNGRAKRAAKRADVTMPSTAAARTGKSDFYSIAADPLPVGTGSPALPGSVSACDRCLLAGSKQTGRKAVIHRRHASGMASDAASSTMRCGPRPGSLAGGGITRKPPSGLRTDLTVPAGLRPGLEEPRCAPVGGTAENAGVTWERVNAEDGDLRACPSVDRSATPRLLEKRRPEVRRSEELTG